MDSGNYRTFLGIPVRTLSLIILLGFIVVGLLAIAYKDMNKKPAASPTINSIDTVSPQTVLSISQNPIQVSTPSGSFYELDILIDTGANKVNSVQLELTFDPNVLQNINIVPGPFMANPDELIKNIDTVDGRISYALTPSAGQTVSGSGIFATLSFSLNSSQKEATQTAISFAPKTEVRAENASHSVLKSAVNSTFTLVPVFTPTPTFMVTHIGTQSAR